MDAKSAPQNEEEMLIDYYQATVATAGGDCYEELVLYSEPDGGLKLVLYSKAPGDEEEASTEYKVPPSAAERCYEIINNNDFRSWNGQKGVGLTGALTVLKFKDGGGYTRVSTENMPAHACKSVFYPVKGILLEYAAKAKGQKRD